ncbi:hypothetical protein ANCDUO_00023 [Ancylostoma duodenale]|uniref:Serine-threonine/tyrosine-protein kinase catalytic domain-containing protein n=1 Tax=Ancylostoma duodenale TaxID=51022 RepID=A0A0C2E2H7_9BILA|nr:hypothetical protein ANCDUO_00023 [Ancylostoma duodenale]
MQVTEWYGSSGTPLEDEPFYHGYMERMETERCLTKNGEFLVRKSLIRNVEVVLGCRLGHGEFGEVFKGSLTVGLFTKPIEVAVKTLKEGSLSSDDR